MLVVTAVLCCSPFTTLATGVRQVAGAGRKCSGQRQSGSKVFYFLFISFCFFGRDHSHSTLKSSNTWWGDSESNPLEPRPKILFTFLHLQSMQSELFRTKESTSRKCITNGEPVKVILKSIKINLPDDFLC